MKPIQSELNKRMDESFQKRFNEIQAELMENPAIKQFFHDNENDITSDSINRGLGKLYEFSNQQNDCSKCESVAKCVNPLNGFIPKLNVNRGLIDIEYMPCKQKRIEDDRRETASRISSMHMPKDVLRATLEDISVYNDDRAKLLELAKKFIDEVRETGNLPQKGFYLFGDFGVGKSFLIGAIANELATLQVQSVVVYVPEFLRELKNAIGTPQLEEKIDFVKKADVLMLDDLGAEALSPWTRDEILGAILHYRMAEQLPTFITSNLDYVELEKAIAKTTKGEEEPLKAARIMERIKAVTTPIFVEGYNLRDM